MPGLTIMNFAIEVIGVSWLPLVYWRVNCWVSRPLLSAGAVISKVNVAVWFRATCNSEKFILAGTVKVEACAFWSVIVSQTVPGCQVVEPVLVNVAVNFWV